ncbi:hypothetical protein [Alicyclobacillus sp.]|uniref:hypothetical protein n=1 Tax=Alicyclobacillus sp. TaxID=61169 RepID=UPI0025BD9A7C|nr:hypothetical protein [Alicyclobacillus sp.]MCL6517267.1 hypothetical protein [Alicyclobacillus sp.]
MDRDVVLSGHLHEAEQHLMEMVNEERRAGEYYLAAVVQDSLVYSLHGWAGSIALPQVGQRAAELAVRCAHRGVGGHRFAVHEAVRGAYHALINLGGAPAEMASAVATGAMAAVSEAEREAAADLTDAIVSGLCAAAADLGLDPAWMHELAAQAVSRGVAGRPDAMDGAWRGEDDGRAAQAFS